MNYLSPTLLTAVVTLECQEFLLIILATNLFLRTDSRASDTISSGDSFWRDPKDLEIPCSFIPTNIILI